MSYVNTHVVWSEMLWLVTNISEERCQGFRGCQRRIWVLRLMICWIVAVYRMLEYACLPCQVIGECWIVNHVFFCLRFGVHIPLFVLSSCTCNSWSLHLLWICGFETPDFVVFPRGERSGTLKKAYGWYVEHSLLFLLLRCTDLLGSFPFISEFLLCPAIGHGADVLSLLGSSIP